MTLRQILKDPLVHFLIAGALLFAVGNALKPAETAATDIIVDRGALLQFIQYRSKAFEPNAAAAILDGFDAKARRALVRDYVREEALAREAAALSLGANDYVIRQRMVQKTQFLAEAGAVAAEPTQAELVAYYDAFRERYTSPPSATLTHVFVSFDGRTRDQARDEAIRLLAILRAAKAGFNDATRYGERFLFHKNYVDRTEDYIRSQLGDTAADAAFDPASPLDAWLGPYASDYGDHLILVSARTPARLPPLSEIAPIVRADLIEKRRNEAIEQAIDAIVSKYTVIDRSKAAG